MQKGLIRKITNISEELSKVQDEFINDAEENYEKHFEEYIKLDESLDGRYICSDLFKITFPTYSNSIESKKKYGIIVHNSAAVLSGEFFNRQIRKDNIKKCIFLTGIPGAGKTYFIQSLALEDEIDKDTLIFEGDITSPTIYDKMDKCVENNVDIYVIVINPTLKLAQENVINRHFEIGRGASCGLMARIASKIPKSIEEITKRYNIELGIYNKTTNYDITSKIGIENINDLNHGSYEKILSKLEYYREDILNRIKESKENEHDKKI